MATITIELQKGICIGDQHYTTATLRNLNAADILRISEESEKAFATPEGYISLPSNTVIQRKSLLTQVVSIGDIQGPLEESMLTKLSDVDLLLLQAAQSELDNIQDAAFEAVTRRGRSDGDGGQRGPAVTTDRDTDNDCMDAHGTAATSAT